MSSSVSGNTSDFNKKVYKAFFSNDNLRFKKFRWKLLVILQELSMGKFRAIAKYYYKSSYRKDINYLCDILSKGRLRGRRSSLFLKDISSSHEINYPSWVHHLEKNLRRNGDYKRIKVFFDNNKGWIVIDGNHRLEALKNFYSSAGEYTIVDVLVLEYENEKI